ncbi:MAG: hypothetical protein M1837_006235 [Sclerophora amabilis]|nr:MAG: hypothetical protein M1837_006235 [Sclerophora amabilis]
MPHINLALVSLLLPVAWTFPTLSGYGPGPYKTGYPITTGSSPAGSAVAPYGMGNGTAAPSPSGTGSGTGSGPSAGPDLTTTIDLTSTTTIFSTVFPSSTVDASPDESVSDVEAGPSQGSPGGGGSGGDSCGPATVTVTSETTVTVAPSPSQNGTGVASSFVATSVSKAASSEAASSSKDTSLPEASSLPQAVSSTEPASSTGPTSSTEPVSSTEPTSSLKATPSSKAASSSTSAPAESIESSADVAPSSPSGRSKRGLICQPELVVPMTPYEKITWDMNWWNGAPPNQPANWTFVPMLTHLEPDEFWKPNIESAKTENVPYIFGFLELDGPVDDAVKSWKENIEPYADDFQLIPPVPVNNGVPWLLEFMDKCTGCTFNGPIAFNLYVTADESGVADFKSHVEDVMSKFPDKELWVANFGQLGTEGENDDEWLMRRLLPYLDGIDQITHYAWTGLETFWDGSNITPLAELYATL